MRTTLNLNEQLVRRAKRVAAERGTTLTAIIEDALREKLTRPAPQAKKKLTRPAPQAKKKRTLHTFKGDGLQPGVELSSIAAIF